MSRSARRIQTPEQAHGILVPTPPEIACQGPELLLYGCDEPGQRACFTHYWSDLRSGVHHHANLVLAEVAGRQGLHREYALQHAFID